MILLRKGNLCNCNGRSTLIAFRILVKPHKSLYQNSLEKISDWSHKCFPVTFAKFFKDHLQTAASEGITCKTKSESKLG